MIRLKIFAFEFFVLSVLSWWGIGCAWVFPPSVKRYIEYPVQSGDTLSQIGARFFVPVTELLDENGLNDPKELRAGSSLKIPYRGQTLARTERDARGGPARERARARIKELVTPKTGGSKNLISYGKSARYIGKLFWPLSNRKTLSSRFGTRSDNFHEGVDIRAPEGTHVYAAHDGVVVHSGNRLRGYGNIVVLKGADILTIYAHNHRNRIRTGEKVARGQVIAEVGETGKANGPHLHFEVRINSSRGKNTAVDPLAFFPSIR